MSTKTTLCDRCEKLNGPCDGKDTSHWICSRRIWAHDLIRPYVESIVSVLVDNKLFETRDTLDNSEYLPGNLTNAILDYLEKECIVMTDYSGKKPGIISRDYKVEWQFESKLEWEETVKKSWEKEGKKKE